MKFFIVTTYGTDGKRSRLEYARNEMECVKHIQNEATKVVSVKQLHFEFWDREFIGTNEKISFLQALSFQASANSATKALKNVIAETNDKSIKKATFPALVALEQGETFSRALKAVKMFNPITLAILESGERTGKVKASIDTAIWQLERKKAVAKLIGGVILWVGVDIVFAITTAVGMQFELLPLLSQIGLQKATPEQIAIYNTRLDMLYLANGILIGIGAILAALFVALSVYIFSEHKIKEKIEPFVMLVPQLKSFFQNTAFSDSFLIFSSLSKGGVKIQQAIEISKKSTTYAFCKGFWNTVADNLMFRAKNISASFATKELTDGEKSLIASHVDYQSLSVAIKKISEDRFEKSRIDANKIKIKMLTLVGIYTIASIVIGVFALVLQDQSFSSYFKI